MRDEGTGIHVFSNGTEFDIWEHNNSSRCVKEPSCDILAALFMDGLEEGLYQGQVKPETAKRLGVPADGRERWWCLERQTETDEPTWPPPLIEGEPVQLPGFDQVDEKPAEQRRQPWTG